MRFYRKTGPVVVTVVSIAVLAMLLFVLRPEPRLSERFGFSSTPASDISAAWGSLSVDFSSPLRRLVVLKDVEFRDSSGTYEYVQAWVNTGVGGGAFYADTLDEYGGFELIDVKDYNVRDARLNMILKLQPTGIASGSAKYAGSNHITLRYTYAGLPFVRYLTWDPNSR